MVKTIVSKSQLVSIHLYNPFDIYLEFISICITANTKIESEYCHNIYQLSKMTKSPVCLILFSAMFSAYTHKCDKCEETITEAFCFAIVVILEILII